MYSIETVYGISPGSCRMDLNPWASNLCFSGEIEGPGLTVKKKKKRETVFLFGWFLLLFLFVYLRNDKHIQEWKWTGEFKESYMFPKF